MIKVTVGNNVRRNSVIVDEQTRGTMHRDGSTLQPGDLDKTFEEMGIKEKTFLLNVVKADNA